MAEKLLKNEYKTPWAVVRGVFLEGAIADSLCPTIKNGKVWYEEYTTEDLATPVGRDITIL
jgi:hypothetical protein